MITCEERKNRLLKANNLMKRLNLNSILVVGNGSVATNEYGFYRYFVDNRVYYHRQALVIVADETPTVCCGSLTHLKALNERGFWDVRMVGDRLAEGLVDILGSRGITNGRIGYCPETLPASWFDCIHSAYPELEWVDCTMEITPRYNGYWTQLVRTISVGEPNEDFIKMHEVSCRIIKGALEELKPGNRIGNIATKLKQLTEEAGCVRTHSHMRMDIIDTFLPEKIKPYVDMIRELIVGVVFGYAAIIVASYIPVVKRTGMTTSSLDIPQYILYYAMPVGFGLMVFWSIVNIVMDIKKIRNGDAGLDESDSVSMKTE